jgi:hypothetical protein
VVVVLEDRKRLEALRQKLAAQDPPPLAVVAIGNGETELASVERLDPAAGRRQRQKTMMRWLLPFGFMAGFTFTQITDLHTFSALGPWAEPLIGGLLGLGSGWMGSFAAAASVPSEDDDQVRILRNRLQEGNWLLLLETRNGVELPWRLLQQAGARALVRLSED